MSQNNPKEPVGKQGQTEKERRALLAKRCAKAMAAKCHQCTELDGTLEGRILAYWQIGKALEMCTLAAHGDTYGIDLVNVFIEEWQSRGGFQFGPGQAKYMRMFAQAFDDQLLIKAIDSGIPWSALRELSAERISSQARHEILDDVLSGWLEPEHALREIQSRPDTKPQAMMPKIRQAERALHGVRRQLNALRSSLERLDEATDAAFKERLTYNRHDTHMKRDAPKKSTPQKVVEFCTRVIDTNELAKQCGVPWTDRAEKARKQRQKARQKMARRAKK